MSLKYSVITIWTSETAAFKGTRLSKAVPQFVKGLKIAARCMVTKGVGGCYENGELATGGVEVLSFNMPVKIEIVLPAAEAELALRPLGEMVGDGVVLLHDGIAGSHRVEKRLIPRHLLARDIMTPSPQTVTAATPVVDAVKLLLGSNFNGLPVVDGRGHPVGVLTQGDLIARCGMPVRLGLLDALEAGQLDAALAALAGRTVGEAMTSPAVCLREDNAVEEAVKLMLEKRLKRFPVVDAAGELRGVLARYDIFRSIVRDAPDWDAISGKGVQVSGDSRVRSAMRHDVPIVSPTTPLGELPTLVDASDMQRLAVVGPDGVLLGMVFDSALLSAFAASGSLTQFLRARPFSLKNLLLDKGLAGKTARDVMETGIVTIGEDARVEEAIRVMAERGIKRLPVVDADNKYLGMLSRDALLR